MDKNSVSNLRFANNVKKECSFCSKSFSVANIKRHEQACSKNPKNQKECPVCKKIHSKKSVTCGYSCSNTYFRSGSDNPNYGNYRTICFDNHGKKCIVCGEDKIVSVHHVNEDHSDNRPKNLVPLCPTHHQYVHSKYKDEIQPIIEKYLQGVG